MSGAWGTLTTGDTNGADEQWVGDLNEVGLTCLGCQNETFFFSNGGDFGGGGDIACGSNERPTIRYDYDIVGFGISLSSNRDLTDIGVGGGWSGDFGAGSFTAGVGYYDFTGLWRRLPGLGYRLRRLVRRAPVVGRARRRVRLRGRGDVQREADLHPVRIRKRCHRMSTATSGRPASASAPGSVPGRSTPTTSRSSTPVASSTTSTACRATASAPPTTSAAAPASRAASARCGASATRTTASWSPTSVSAWRSDPGQRGSERERRAAARLSFVWRDRAAGCVGGGPGPRRRRPPRRRAWRSSATPGSASATTSTATARRPARTMSARSTASASAST